MGLPRIYERFLELSGVSGQAAQTKKAEFVDLVQAYANPAIYPHRDFYERAYADYREGRELSSPQYMTDLQALDKWLSDLETVLGKIPGYFATEN